MVNKEGQGGVGPGKKMEGVSIPIMAATRFNREKLTDEVSKYVCTVWQGYMSSGLLIFFCLHRNPVVEK